MICANRETRDEKGTKKDVEEDDSKVIDKQWQNFISLSRTASRDKDELGFQNSNMNSGNKREDVLKGHRHIICENLNVKRICKNLNVNHVCENLCPTSTDS